jgi:hypothetical protein
VSDQVQYEIVTILIRIAAFGIIPVATCMLWLYRKAISLQSAQDDMAAWRSGNDRREAAFANHVKLEVLGVVNQTVNSQYLEIRTAIAVMQTKLDMITKANDRREERDERATSGGH